jgi:DNA polymerase III subunit gamma/tau
MSYLVLARKYRPQSFAQVVQQEHVTRTLANAIAADRMAHAILFSGPRGTGKTTVARILAKAMNCVEGPTATPCNQCQSCLEITQGHAADVFEIDGASNNSVDQVRELRENLKYMPAHSRYKIYIIDEVHMLSLAAFNALLKTLEEPPSHVLFMFATTEPHKIPITILSRCQRHDLRRIDSEAIIGHLKQLCQKEQVEIDDASLVLIAQEGSGSMRDCLSLLDHVLACAQGAVTEQLISELLGVVERKHLFEISSAVFQRDLQRVLEGIDAVWRHGYEIKRFYADLVAHFHHLAIVKMGPRASQLVDLPAHEIDQMRRQVCDVSDIYLLQIFDLLFQAEPATKLSSQPKLALEMVFLKLFQTAPALPIETLINRLDQLQSQLPAAGSAVVPLPTPGLGVASKKNAALPTSRAEAPLPALPAEQDDATTAEAALPEIGGMWAEMLAHIAEQKPSVAAFLNSCSPSWSDGGNLRLEVEGSEFTLKNITKHQAFLEQSGSRVAGRDLKIEIKANVEATVAKQKQQQNSHRLKQDALSHPLVMKAQELFNGRIVDIKVP